MSVNMEERLALLETAVLALGLELESLKERVAEPEDRLAAGYARFMARKKTEREDAEPRD